MNDLTEEIYGDRLTGRAPAGDVTPRDVCGPVDAPRPHDWRSVTAGIRECSYCLTQTTDPAFKSTMTQDERNARIVTLSYLAFPEGSLEGLAQGLLDLYTERARLNRDIPARESTIIDRIKRDGELPVLPNGRTLRLIRTWTNGRHEPVESLRFDRWCKRCKTWADEVKGNVCGSCADDLRGEPTPEDERGAGSIGIVDFDAGGLIDAELAR